MDPVFLYTRIGSDGVHQSTYYLPISVLSQYPALDALVRAAPRIVSAKSEDLVRRISAELLYALSMGPEEPSMTLSMGTDEPTKKRVRGPSDTHDFKILVDRVLSELGFTTTPVWDTARNAFAFDRCGLRWPRGDDFPWLLRLQRDPPFPPIDLMVIEN